MDQSQSQFTCNSCGQKFQNDRELKEHNQKMHQSGQKQQAGGNQPVGQGGSSGQGQGRGSSQGQGQRDKTRTAGGGGNPEKESGA